MNEAQPLHLQCMRVGAGTRRERRWRTVLEVSAHQLDEASRLVTLAEQLDSEPRWRLADVASGAVLHLDNGRWTA